MHRRSEDSSLMSKTSPYALKDSGLFVPSSPQEFFKTEVRTVDQGYFGVFAIEQIPQGAIIGIDGGTVVSSVEDVPPEKRYAVLITEGLFLAPNDYEHLENFWYLNHSCTANVARIGGLVFVAKKMITIGEQLTIDYAPLIAGVPQWTMDCLCKAPSCRGRISGEDWRDPKIADHLWHEWLPFIQKRILANRS